ncbi:MAG: hypothetical protein ABSD08_20660 [Xanthobacteraceae bacterium]|jgi:hypothetical protein
MKCRLGTAAGFLSGVAVAAVVGLHSASVWADDAQAVIRSTPSAASFAAIALSKKTSSAAKTGTADAYNPAKRYFVEFRARNAASYGHMYVMYGEVNDRQEIIRSEIAGFFPAGDTRDCVNCGVVNWTVGHVVFVPSEIGASDGDLEEKYVLARFRVWIDAAQYQRLVAYIKQRKANKTPWNAFLNNCVTFGRDVAVFMNLKVPFVIAAAPSVVMYPETLVNSLREANGVQTEQGPLKDAPGSLAAPSGSASGTPLPPQKPKVQPAVTAQPSAAKTSHTPPTPKKPVASLPNEATVASSTIH